MISVIDDRQTTGSLLMVRPRRFSANSQTASSNAFQRVPHGMEADSVAARALAEFELMASGLSGAGVETVVFDDTVEPEKPDAIFPNNWVSLHADGTVILYPMEAPNRRHERRVDILESLSADRGYFIREIIDLSPLENRGLYLEGTGSLVLDRRNRQAYAALSSRTSMDALAEFSQLTGYEVTVFDARGPRGLPVYHTNVMMGIGERFAVICGEAITDPAKRADVLGRLSATGRDVIDLTAAQVTRFAGNLLEVSSARGGVIVISKVAHGVLRPEQLDRLGDCGQFLVMDIGTIEAAGGGSVRCMIAENFLPRAGSAQSKGAAV